MLRGEVLRENPCPGSLTRQAIARRERMNEISTCWLASKCAPCSMALIRISLKAEITLSLSAWEMSPKSVQELDKAIGGK